MVHQCALACRAPRQPDVFASAHRSHAHTRAHATEERTVRSAQYGRREKKGKGMDGRERQKRQWESGRDGETGTLFVIGFSLLRKKSNRTRVFVVCIAKGGREQFQHGTRAL